MIGLAAQEGKTFAELSMQATAAREANDVPHAIDLYGLAVRMNPSWEEGWWFLGSLLYDSDRFTEGSEALAHVTALDSRAGPAWGLLGLCEFETGHYQSSLEHIQRGLAAASTEPQMEGVLRYHEALLLTHEGQFEKALQKYAWFAKNNVQNSELVLGMGLAALRNPRFPKDLPANDQELYRMTGTAVYFNMAGDSREAQSSYETVLSKYPRARNLHYAYGCFLLGVNQDLGLMELRRELEITPSGAVNAMLAFVLLERGELQAALPYADKAAQLDPESELAQYVLGRALAEHGELERGIHHLELAEKIDAMDLQAHISLATAYSRAGRPQDARRERQRAIELATGAAAVAGH